MVNQTCQASHWDNQELHAKSVMVGIISCLELYVHQVDSAKWTHYVDYFHHGVVDRDEVDEEIKVSCCENKSKKNLTLAWQAWKKKQKFWITLRKRNFLLYTPTYVNTEEIMSNY